MKEKVFISYGDLILDKIYDGNFNLLKQDGGGCNWNDLYNLSLLGERCYAIGSRGNDIEGEIALESLKSSNTNTDYIITENRTTNVIHIIIPNGKLDDNSVLHSWYSPVDYKLTMHHSESLPLDLPKELLDKEIYLILDLFEPVDLKFLEKNQNLILCFDIGHTRSFEHFTKEYLSKFLDRVKFIQVNSGITDILFERFNVKNIFEFFCLFNFDLLILTKGKSGADFLFLQDNEVVRISKKPEVIANVVDTAGAGDAFFSKALQQYAYTEKIDSVFIEQTFKLANQFSREVISQVGSRIKK